MGSPEGLSTPEVKRFDPETIRKHLAEFGLNMPVYDASDDSYPNPDHEDERWASGNIVPSSN